MNARASAALVVVAVVSVGCALPGTGGSVSQPAVRAVRSSAPPPPLARAIQIAMHLGRAGAGTEVHLDFGLKTREPGRLAALLAAGETVTPAEYSVEFGADPALVGQALARLHDAGLNATWLSGSNLVQADGPAPAVAALLEVDIQDYRLPGGKTFYASLDTPTLVPPLAAVVTSVAGLDSYARTRSYAVKPGGLKPADVLTFYGLNALRSRGLDGTGETILFPELESLPHGGLDDLNKFASEFSLPPFDNVLQVKLNPSWGTPQQPQGEAVLDLEIAHEVAPYAKLVVYESGPEFVYLDRAFDQMVTDHLGSIISESLGACEADSPSGHRDLYASIQDRAQAQGMTHFVASGDSGAYTCGQDQEPAASFPATLPTVTAVGGTTVFESTQGGYFKEVAWGSPIDESGTGGGPSQFYPRPDWQKPVEDARGHGFRQVPDVAADADPITGFHIVFGGQDTQAGGTSAATPLWSATIALINQDLVSRHLREVGFANPAIYWMGENHARFTSAPFHDVTAGNNLAYAAGPGWDFATGWGSMNADALDAAWVLYIKSGGS